MTETVRSIIDYGSSGLLIDVECHLSKGLPGMVIVGLAARAVDEAKERIRSAFSSANLQLPRKRITVNLAPGDIPKDSTAFDLAIGTAILAANGQLSVPVPSDALVIGELGLGGQVRPVRGIIGKILAGREQGFKQFFIPKQNLRQACLIPGVTLLPVEAITDVYMHLTGDVQIEAIATKGGLLSGVETHNFDNDFGQVSGQVRAKRALEIAAAGAHNVLLTGPPGTGKSMLAKSLPTILPPLTREEVLEVTHLHSLSSRQYDHLVAARPFRAPHHSATASSIIGGGQRPRPGEISLAHRGVLFLDEFPEFDRATIESLRQPLEDRVITVARARDNVIFPASFILIATANPCPCGYNGTTKECFCTMHEIARYQKKLSGPIIDRIDMYVDVEEVVHGTLLDVGTQETSATIAARVSAARAKQRRRFKSLTTTNSDMTNQGIRELALLDPEAKQLLDTAAASLNISARHYMRAIKVARTIADLENSTNVTKQHIAEALQYRKRPQQL